MKVVVEEADDRLDLARWIISRSDGLRQAYSGRAATVISADAITLAVIVLVADGLLSHVATPFQTSVRLAISVALCCLCASIVLSMMAAAAIRKSSKLAGYSGSPRAFFNPRDTFDKYVQFDDYLAAFNTLSASSLSEAAAGELWVGLKLQQNDITISDGRCSRSSQGS
jgi:hypothetical protein